MNYLGKRENLVGNQYGRLVVMRLSERRGRWHCQCLCGATSEVRAANLKGGMTESCGCLRDNRPLPKRAEWTAEYILETLPKSELFLARGIPLPVIDLTVP